MRLLLQKDGITLIKNTTNFIMNDSTNVQHFGLYFKQCIFNKFKEVQIFLQLYFIVPP